MNIRALTLKFINKKVLLSESSIITVNLIFDFFEENNYNIEMTTNYMKEKIGSTDNSIKLISSALIYYKEQINSPSSSP